MAKFYGNIGFMTTKMTAPDVWTESIVERPYYGDMLKATRQWDAGENLNDDTNINNRISIVADPFALNHFGSIRYIVLSDQKWKVKSIDVEYPRLVLALGGVYNEN